jgi:ATP-dependent RNA helicase DHR2
MPDRRRTVSGHNDGAIETSSSMASAEMASGLPIQGKKRKRREILEPTKSDPPHGPQNKSLEETKSVDMETHKNSGSKSYSNLNGKSRDNTLPRKEQIVKKYGNLNEASRKPYEHSKPLLEKRQKLLVTRKQLPIWPHAEKIRRGLRGAKDIMLLVGETGSGKSTQVPQFLLDESWCTGCIAITQPRRVAAISLARRVADEMGTPLGSASPASKVGYSVRFDVNTSPSTRIKFLTEGTLLQEMLRDPWLKQYSAVIVDEVHERSVNVDLILGFLRNLISGDQKGRKGRPLKVVVMSATADVDSLFKFFNAACCTKTLASKNVDNADGSEKSWGGISSDDDEPVLKPTESPHTANGRPSTTSANEMSTIEKLGSDRITVCYIKGRQYAVKTHYLSEPTQDFVEEALKAIFKLHTQEPLPGDILVFLTGQDTVESLERLVNDYASTMDPKYPKVGSNKQSTL